jgi:large subunit ribosomal protein L44e
MKIPKKQKKHCPKCKTHKEMTVSPVKKKTRSSVHTMSRGATSRMRRRGLRRGFGNQNKYSRPTKPKRSGAKLSKKVNLKFTCPTCHKSFGFGSKPRAKKMEMV